MKKNIIIAVLALISAASLSWNYLQPVRAMPDPVVSYTDTDNIGAFIVQEANDGRGFGCYEILPPSEIPPNAPPDPPVFYDLKVTYDRGTTCL
jgi:hypothetical protein